MKIYWEDWASGLWEAWVEIGLHTFCCVIITSLTIFCVFKICHNNYIDSSIENRFYKHVFISLIVTVIYIYLTYFINVLSILIFGWRPHMGCFYRQIATIPLAMQRVIALYFYILRLRVSFQGSVAELSSKCTYIFIGCVTINGIITTTFYMIALYLWNINDDSFVCGWTALRYISGLLLVFGDTLWSIVFTGIYVKKLRQVFKLVGITNEKTVYVVKRLSVLAMTSVISSYISIIIYTVTDSKFTYQIISIDLIVNNICIMLSFKEFDGFYENLCCCYNKCCNIKNHTERRLSGYVGNNQMVITAQENGNHNIGEPTAMTYARTVNHTVTHTQNEGRQRLPTSNNNDNETPRFQVNSIELSNNISFTSKIRDKNDSIIQKHLAENQIAIFQATKQ